jgi:hypothetical protein
LGLTGDIVVGILGALIAAWLFPKLGIALTLGGGLFGAIILGLHRGGDPARDRQGDQAAHRLGAAPLIPRHLHVTAAGRCRHRGNIV